MYENTATGLQKASHERMLNNQGRKVIKEKQRDQVNNYDHFKNMTVDDGQQFDRAWSNAANKFGFSSIGGNN